MEPHELQEMVYREVRKRLMTPKSSSGTNNDPASVLVVLNRIDPKLGEVFYRLRELEANGISITVVLSDDVDGLCRKEGLLPVMGINFIYVSELPRIILDLHNYSTIFFPVIGFSLARRLAALDDDDQFVHLAVSSIISGKSVCVATDSIIPGENVMPSPLINEASNEITKSLSGIGVKLLPISDFTSNISFKKNLFQGKVITEETIKEFRENKLWDINILPNVVVTPLAKDKAKELGIRINSVE
jgi:hypothetical protein